MKRERKREGKEREKEGRREGGRGRKGGRKKTAEGREGKQKNERETTIVHSSYYESVHDYIILTHPQIVI